MNSLTVHNTTLKGKDVWENLNIAGNRGKQSKVR